MLSPRPFGRLGSRSVARLQLQLEVKLQLAASSISGRTRNISRVGASVMLNAPVAKGTDGLLRLADISIFSSVIWTRGEVCGLRFHRPLAEEKMLLIQRIAQDPQAYDIVRLSGEGSNWR